MRDALVRAAQALPGDVNAMILSADKRIKRTVFGGWRVLNKRKRRGRGRSRRT